MVVEAVVASTEALQTVDVAPSVTITVLITVDVTVVTPLSDAPTVVVTMLGLAVSRYDAAVQYDDAAEGRQARSLASADEHASVADVIDIDAISVNGIEARIAGPMQELERK